MALENDLCGHISLSLLAYSTTSHASQIGSSASQARAKDRKGKSHINKGRAGVGSPIFFVLPTCPCYAEAPYRLGASYQAGSRSFPIHDLAGHDCRVDRTIFIEQDEVGVFAGFNSAFAVLKTQHPGRVLGSGSDRNFQ